MQRLLFHRSLAAAALAVLAGAVLAADYKLNSGTTITGDPFSYSDKGVVIRSDGKTLDRMAWTNFTQEALKEFAKNPKARQFVETLIDAPVPGDGTGGAEPIVAEMPVSKRPPAKWNKEIGPPKLPDSPGLIGGMFGTGIGWLSLFVVYAATIYAGYEVSLYRRRPKNLVMGLAAIPLVGIFSPITFLIMPGIKTEDETKLNSVELAAQQAKEGHKPEEKKGYELGKNKNKPASAKPVATAKPGGHAAPAAPAPSPVKAPVAPGAPAAAASLEPVVYRRGETNINKRFIETKFAGFFKLAPGPAERDMWLVWLTATGGEYWSKRVVSISQTEIVVNCPQENGGSLDQTLQLVEIQEIHLRPQEG